MAILFFENSVDFKHYTAKVCGDLNRTKLNQLRHAISKSMGYPHLDLLYKDLDSKSGMHLDVGPESCKEALANKNLSMPYNGMKIVAFSNPRGGSGKTLLSSMLAISAASGFYDSVKRPVLAIDYDYQCNMSGKLLRPEDHGYFGMLDDAGDINLSDEFIGGSHSVLFGGSTQCHQTPNFNGLYCVPSDSVFSRTFENICKNGATNISKEDIDSRLRSFFELDEVNREFDLVVVDLPPSDTAIRDSVLSICTDVVVTSSCDKWDVITVDKQLAEIDAINGARDIPLNVAAIVLNDFIDSDPEHRFVWKHFDRGLREHSRFGDAIVGSAIPRIEGLGKNDIININDVELFHKHAACFLRKVGQRVYGESD